MHEQVQERAEGQDRPREETDRVGAMLGPQEIGGSQGEPDQRNPTARPESILRSLRHRISPVGITHWGSHLVEYYAPPPSE
jgi:hypothetical protein